MIDLFIWEWRSVQSLSAMQHQTVTTCLSDLWTGFLAIFPNGRQNAIGARVGLRSYFGHFVGLPTCKGGKFRSRRSYGIATGNDLQAWKAAWSLSGRDK